MYRTYTQRKGRKACFSRNECSEECYTETLGAPWFEFSEIWHFCGPYPDVSVSDENGNDIEFGLFDGDIDALKKIDPLSVHRMCEEISNDDLKSNCILITVSPEKGHWGQLIADDLNIQNLEVVQYDPDFTDSIYTAIAFVIDGQPVYWERANETEVNSP